MDRSEFEHLALGHLDACYRLALHLTGDGDAAVDLVQETFLRALRHVEAGGFRETGKGMRAWLFTILHNEFRRTRGRESRQPSSMPELERLPEVGVADPADCPPPAWDLRSLDWEQVDDRLRRGIEGLSAEQRVVLLLWGVEGMTYREIASIVGVPVGTVMSRLHRARAILARSLEELRRELGWKGGRDAR